MNCLSSVGSNYKGTKNLLNLLELVSDLNEHSMRSRQGAHIYILISPFPNSPKGSKENITPGPRVVTLHSSLRLASIHFIISKSKKI